MGYSSFAVTHFYLAPSTFSKVERHATCQLISPVHALGIGRQDGLDESFMAQPVMQRLQQRGIVGERLVIGTRPVAPPKQAVGPEFTQPQARQRAGVESAQSVSGTQLDIYLAVPCRARAPRVRTVLSLAEIASGLPIWSITSGIASGSCATTCGNSPLSVCSSRCQPSNSSASQSEAALDH